MKNSSGSSSSTYLNLRSGSLFNLKIHNNFGTFTFQTFVVTYPLETDWPPVSQLLELPPLSKICPFSLAPGNLSISKSIKRS